GGERYTRNGSFHLDGGTLRTAEGYPVLFVDNNGQTVSNVQLASGFKINTDGTVIDQQGRSLRLKVVEGPVQSFNRETNLGQSLYAANQAPQLANGNIVVHQGMIEHSNVDLAGQMTHMITVMRAYEANQKAIQAQDGLTDKAANEVGKV
ncbi:MAG TPA: flagellar basal body rod C-terminal domain-containing protein, partial [Desulfobacteria bacterium]|nr:flagellar basal body rod C-terminal domain-containing protein [Desulfobacteria bacterium]